jgi:gamma-F420-2:alpha-L-glutamate ligase
MKGFILYYGPLDNIELKLLLEAAKNASIECDIINPRKLSVMTSSDASYLLLEGEKIELPDFVIAGFAGDPSYANISLLQQLETMGVACFNTAKTMKITQDKLLTSQLLFQAGLPIPKTMLISPATTIEIIENEFSFPIVVKTVNGSKGSGVILVENKKEMKNIIQLSNSSNFHDQLIIQEMIATSKGRDLRVVVMGRKAVTCALRTSATTTEFKSNYSLGGTIVHYKLTPEIEELANKITEVLGLFTGGIDLLFTNNGFTICEVNSVPGFYLPRNPGVWEMDIPASLFEGIKNELS